MTFVASSFIFPIRNMKTINNSKDLGGIIRSERRRMGVTQKQLAMTAGVGLRFLIELESGKPTAQMKGMFKVLQALGMKMGVLGPSDEGSISDR